LPRVTRFESPLAGPGCRALARASDDYLALAFLAVDTGDEVGMPRSACRISATPDARLPVTVQY
jgi:hypothetical protein